MSILLQCPQTCSFFRALRRITLQHHPGRRNRYLRCISRSWDQALRLAHKRACKQSFQEETAERGRIGPRGYFYSAESAFEFYAYASPIAQRSGLPLRYGSTLDTCRNHGTFRGTLQGVPTRGVRCFARAAPEWNGSQ